AAADGRGARGAVRRAHATRREARRARGPTRVGARGDRRPEPGRKARSAQCTSGDRREEPVHALGCRTGCERRARDACGARTTQHRVRGTVRLSVRRLREPPPEERDRPDPARATRALPRTGARHGRARAGRDRGGPVASLLVTLTLDPYVTDWLNLLTRWLHVIAGIVWIGSSFYFIALDNHLRPPQDERDRDAGVGGETWEIHGGGFYQVQKYRVAPHVLPEPQHWFKWEAYTTWLSGFALLIVLYYAHADTYLIDKSVADLSTWEAIAISVGLLVAAWFVYDTLCRLLASQPLALAGVLLALITLA